MVAGRSVRPTSPENGPSPGRATVRYCVFLSYSHNDAHWARWLMRKLESYRVPKRLVGTHGRDGPIPARLGVVFRDRDELPTAGDLSTTIKEALSESAALVVVCSPASARSQWVDAEVRSFLANGRADRVFCFIVDGEPTVDNCFPPSTIEDGREPLAADARAEGDGKDRAVLKLIAGLLGVGYDTLVQREAQRRNRRLALVAAASVAGMAITSSLAITAHLARNDAQRRQAQAEDLLGFMLGDLRQKLTTVGRLDLMRTVDDKATTYFAELDPRDLSDTALEEQARSLTGIGQVRLEATNYKAAMTAFREAHERTSALYERDTSKGQRLFDRAQTEYWIGYVAMQEGNLDEAERWLTRYRDSALQLAPMDPKNFDWQKEAAYGYHNLAVMQETRGHHEAAEHAMKRELELFRGWVKQRPNDQKLKEEEAVIISWLGTNAKRQGRDAEAETWFAALLDSATARRKAEPDVAEWRRDWVDAQLLLTEARFDNGDFVNARVAMEAANREADALRRHDPENRTWASQQAIARYWRAALDGIGQPRRAMPIAKEAEQMFATMLKAEPNDTRVSKWLERTRKLESNLARQEVALQ
nr:toll/interleukin-1 receptor domain-containing protein [Lysobacter lactosilyticus]